jgi:Ca-activated chloride channel family protein
MDTAQILPAGVPMMITCERPYAFYALLLLIPVCFFMIIKFRRLVKSLGGFYGSAGSIQTASVYRKLKVSLLLRSVSRSLAWVMLVFAYAGLSWGVAPVPVQKSGSAVCFVFDISYSMMAPDASGGRTRLEAERLYADQLLLRMNGTSVAVVLAKGDGIAAIPLTEDMSAVESLLSSLSPALMTAAGTSIGKGIMTAIHSFPANSAQAASIWVFTDGDETDNSLSSALAESVRCGIPVTLIGFGSTKETAVLAGDGVTTVQTALREQKLKAAVAEASRKATVSRRFSFVRSAPVQYVLSSDAGSAMKVLASLRNGKGSGNDDTVFTYEMQSVSRHSVFLLLAIVFFVFSFVAGELVIPDRKQRRSFKKDMLNKTTLVSIFACCLILPLFTSCSGRAKDGARILKSTWAWYQKQYQTAVAGFLQTSEDASKSGDSLVQQYALYGLAVTYMTQEENGSALERLSQIAPDAPQQVRYAAYYNAGIIANRSGDYKKAAALFKQAILADGTKADAKINLELSQKQESTHKAQDAEQEMKSVSENNNESALEKAVFSLIRENEQKKWKNSQSDKKENSAVDY